jgi:hypothetical protein
VGKAFVTKIGLFLTSFVAAVPGAGLAYLMVMAFLNHSGGASLWTKSLAGMLFVVGTLLTLMPFGILVFAGPKVEKAPKKQKDGEEAGSAVVEAESGEAVVAADDEEGGSGSRAAVTDPNLEVMDGSADDFAMTGEVVAGDDAASEAVEDDSDFEVNATGTESEEDLFEMDEEPPKKGKKK